MPMPMTMTVRSGQMTRRMAAVSGRSTGAHKVLLVDFAGGSHRTPVASSRRWYPEASSSLGGLLILASIFTGGSDTAPVQDPESAATKELTQAMAVAKGYLTQDTPHTYRRFGAVEAEAADPTLVWNIEKKAVAGEISIRVSGETGIVLATKDIDGVAFCISDVNAEDEVGTGKVDAAKPDQCQGGW